MEWTKTDALEIGETFKQALRVPQQQYNESLVLLFSLGSKEVINMSSILIQIQLSSCTTNPMIVKPVVLLYTLNKSFDVCFFFHELRTKQQLGYMVGTGLMPLNRHPDSCCTFNRLQQALMA